MASDVVRKVLANVLTNDMWNIKTERAVILEESALYIINKAGREGYNGFNKFAKDIYIYISIYTHTKFLKKFCHICPRQILSPFKRNCRATFTVLDFKKNAWVVV